MHRDEKKKSRISLQIFAKAETLESQLPTNTPVQEELDLLTLFFRTSLKLHFGFLLSQLCSSVRGRSCRTSETNIEFTKPSACSEPLELCVHRVTI